MGALDWNKVVHQHQGWRLISCIWLHAGLIHLVVNMLSLLFIGIRLEQQFGFVRIGAIYLLSGFGGSVMSALFLRNNYISVGASGALFGLLGSMLSELLMNWTIYSNKVAAIITLLFIIAINVAIGILPHADNFAHIGGFLTGFLLGFVLLARPQFGWLERSELPHTNQPPKYKPYQYVLWVVALVLLLVGFTLSLVMLFKGKNGNDGCHWCHYLNCVPTSRLSKRMLSNLKLLMNKLCIEKKLMDEIDIDTIGPQILLSPRASKISGPTLGTELSPLMLLPSVFKVQSLYKIKIVKKLEVSY
ncbi:Inactive rhomboid protein 1 [Triticum urartu]|uniref:RHOMBOID-like protein n=1 Tax=Triticum urartu TaxID=4572 RepID=M7Z757_TRIUA|nr:Inactive rhomboid protein 1 [Triticum urartu]